MKLDSFEAKIKNLSEPVDDIEELLLVRPAGLGREGSADGGGNRGRRGRRRGRCRTHGEILSESGKKEKKKNYDKGKKVETFRLFEKILHLRGCNPR